MTVCDHWLSIFFPLHPLSPSSPPLTPFFSSPFSLLSPLHYFLPFIFSLHPLPFIFSPSSSPFILFPSSSSLHPFPFIFPPSSSSLDVCSRLSVLLEYHKTNAVLMSAFSSILLEIKEHQHLLPGHLTQDTEQCSLTEEPQPQWVCT